MHNHIYVSFHLYIYIYILCIFDLKHIISLPIYIYIYTYIYIYINRISYAHICITYTCQFLHWRTDLWQHPHGEPHGPLPGGYTSGGWPLGSDSLPGGAIPRRETMDFPMKIGLSGYNFPVNQSIESCIFETQELVHAWDCSLLGTKKTVFNWGFNSKLHPMQLPILTMSNLSVFNWASTNMLGPIADGRWSGNSWTPSTPQAHVKKHFSHVSMGWPTLGWRKKWWNHDSGNPKYWAFRCQMIFRFILMCPPISPDCFLIFKFLWRKVLFLSSRFTSPATDIIIPLEIYSPQYLYLQAWSFSIEVPKRAGLHLHPSEIQSSQIDHWIPCE